MGTQVIEDLERAVEEELGKQQKKVHSLLPVMYPGYT